MPARPAARPSALAVALAALTACPEGQSGDPLDPDAIEDLAKSEGDGRGGAYTGTFAFVGTPRGCECPKAGFNLCGVGLTSFAVLDGIFAIAHADGYLTISPTSVQGFSTLAGSVDRDGTFALGAIYDASNVLADLTVYGRLEGEFTSPDALVGDFRYRVLGEYSGEPIECLATAEVEALRQD